MAFALQGVKLKSHDFIEMEQALGAWDHRYEQVSPGAFRGGFHLVGDDTLGVFRNRWERAIHYQGIPPDGVVALGVTLDQARPGLWVGDPVHSDSLMIQPKGVEADFFSGPMWDSLVITIRETELVERIARFAEATPRHFCGDLGLPEWEPRARLALLDLVLRTLERRTGTSGTSTPRQTRVLSKN